MPAGKRPARRKSARHPATSIETRTDDRAPADLPASASPVAAGDEPGAPSAFDLADDQVEVALQTGEHAGLLEDYFGAEQYAELRQLAREAEMRSTRGGPLVLILPGIMGSKIGVRRKGRLFDDVYWIDPLDIRRGRLRELALEPAGGRALTALGVVLLAYLRLKLRLRAAGYDAMFHPFDWRLDIRQLGGELKREMAKAGRGVMLVAHSMGGLVARAAIAQGGECRRLVMLGTPNFGSFAPVQALRGVYPVVRKVAALDRRHDAQALARDVFSTFPGLTQMLPAPERFDLLDLYDRESWPEPHGGLCPRQHILDEVAAMRDGLAAADRSEMLLIAGVDRETVVGIKPDLDPAQGFFYEYSREGDGTVPLTMAHLPGAQTYYVRESHGSLPNNRQVADAVIELLERGSTNRLPSAHDAAPTRALTATLSEADLLARDPYEARRDGVLSQRELRSLIEEVAAPDATDDATAAPRPLEVGAVPVAVLETVGYQHRFDRIIVGRRRQHRIDVRFAFGSITEADTRALALGIFRDVTPGGAAAALDTRVGGAITDLSRRRMFSGNVGEIFMLPTGRHPLPAEIIAFVGLGAFDRFTGEVLQTAAENVIRTFVNARVEEFATVVFGGATSVSPVESLRNQLTGFLRGLRDADRDHHFRRIMICENDATRYVQLKEELYRLSSTELCSDVELTFDEVVLPPPLVAAVPGAVRRDSAHDTVYLIVRQETTTAKSVEVRSSVLSAGAKATVVSGVCTLEQDALKRCQSRLARARPADLPVIGRELGELVLAPAARAILERYREHHLVVVHDAPSSRVPWETLAFGTDSDTWFPAAERGVSRRYAADNLSVAKWLEERVEDGVLSVLLVVDPTRDLQGAVEEGMRIRSLFQSRAGCRLDVLWQDQASRPALMDAFSSGEYDVIHYAGHAFFDQSNPERSGLLCANHARLTGADLAGLGRLPALAFFNACESARVRGASRALRAGWERNDAAAATEKEAQARNDHAREAVGLAEAFMRGGIANFVGTYWPVGDRAAEAFAARFYDGLLQGDAIGDALQEARRVVREDVRSHDWANYLFYGNRDFALKEGLRRPQLSRAPEQERAPAGG